MLSILAQCYIIRGALKDAGAQVTSPEILIELG